MCFKPFPVVFLIKMSLMNGVTIDRELDYFLSNVTEKTCQLCHRKEQCWTRNFNTTYDYLREIMTEMEHKEGRVSAKLYREWDIIV